MKLGTVIFIIATGIVGYKLYNKYKSISVVVNETLDTVNEGAKEFTAFLKRENEILKNRIREKKGKL